MKTLGHRLRNKALAVAVALTALVAMQPEAFAQPQFTLLHSFNGTDGFGPMAGVVQGADGALYGTTRGQEPVQFTIEVTDSLDAASVTGTFKVNTVKTVEIQTKRLEPGKTGKAYEKTLSAGHGMKAYTWALVAGTLPGGVSFDPATGVISGVPTDAGSTTLTFQVTDSLGGRAQDDMTLTIN